MNIIIVGATSGIGRALAESFLADGHRVAITGRRAGLLEEIRQAFPETCVAACHDVQSDNHPYADLVHELGGLDLFVYNAGYGSISKELDPALEVDTTLTNVMGFVRAVAFAFDHFARSGGGQIVLTSSVAAVRGNGFAPAYSASKAFLSNYAEGLNLKAARQRLPIVVTDIRPGFVATKMAQGRLFWVVPVPKAVAQIRTAIGWRCRVAYVSRRWRLVAALLQRLPYGVLRRVG
ncbi:SDR family NAD(P)-dependent oxidoreductase [Flaviaesturariibacter amylovorans]|uniref:SDR family NAD(P)-dependent oxidoreductase n=1 Tax=Flaviaesturariibacter amylovorans TaxID=1084520 RepID=A0ABP8GUW5_9BACT